jgi:phosphoribosylanthranilate isomerase
VVSSHPFVKVCGLTDPAEAVACAKFGVWAIGLVFAPESSRCVDVDQARAISKALPSRVRRVGVFVNPDPAEVARIASAAGLTDVQLHGDRADVEAVRAVARIRVFQGFSVAGPDDVSAARSSRADLVFLDAAVPGRHGGTGQRFDWSVLEHTPLQRPFVLAGGLTPENVADAVRRVRPWGIDVSSGVEASPGHKDLDRVAAFVHAVLDMVEVA